MIDVNGLAPAARPGGPIGFTSKTQWMVQVNVANLGTGGTPGISVYAVRPTGIEDLVHKFTLATGQDSYGGITSASEGPIEGPVAYFKFESDATNNAALDVDCYDICRAPAGALQISMGRQLSKEKTVRLVWDGSDELDVRLDDLESKFEDMLVLITALSKEIGDLKSSKKAPAKTAVKKPAKKKAVK